MRVVSSPFLRRAASMSARYNRPGSSRPHRGYSSRPWPPPAYAYAGAELVSGDSHLSAVHAANDSLRRGGGRARAPPPQYRHGPQFQPPPPPYGYGQPQQPVPAYGAVPYNYSHPQPQPQGPQYGYGVPNQYGHLHPRPYGGVPPNAGFLQRNAGFRPGESTTDCGDLRRSSHGTRLTFKILSYNILADYLAQEHKDLYENISPVFLDWNWRKTKIVFEIGLWHPDILCLQEVDKFKDLEQEMATRGFSGIWKMRTGNAADGGAIFWRTSRFQLRYEEDIEFNKLGLRDNVAQLCVLESVVPRYAQTESIHLSASLSDPQQAKQVVICNIHVLYNPKRGDIKLGQVRTLLDRAYTISKMWNDAPVILCGDFNATPKSPLYNFISEQKLNLSGLARNAVSGQQTSSSQGLYSGSNPSCYSFCPPFHTTNGREGRIIPPDGREPQSEARDLVRDSCVAGGRVLTDTASGSCFNSEPSKSFDNNIPCSGTTNLDKQGLLSCLEGPANNACNSDAETHAKATNSSGTVDSRHLLSSYESSRVKDSDEEVREVSSKDSNAQGDLSGDVIPGDVACGFEGNSVQSNPLSDVSKDNPGQKEKGNESMSGQNNCTNSESESSHFSDPLKYADALQEMSNMRLEEGNNTGPTHLASPVEPVHESNCAISDPCGNQCVPKVINKHSDSYSCAEEFGNHARALEDDASVNDALCSDVNSDPSFFKEFSGDNEYLLVDDDQLPTISNGSPYSQKAVTSYGRYYNDPYRWTADEIKAATGNEECTYVEHKLKVRSVYTDVEDFEGTKDANKEPLVTSYNRKFMGTVDYIWASQDLQTVEVLDTFPKEILKQTTGFPTKTVTYGCQSPNEVIFRRDGHCTPANVVGNYTIDMLLDRDKASCPTGIFNS